MRLNVKNTRSLDGEAVWKTVDDYFSTYWSGLDARIFANDVLLDEILALQWQLTEAVAPLFSYAAYTYDTIMHGARRVQGSFTINYKRDSYLFELLRQLKQPPKRGNPQAPNFRRSEAFKAAANGEATLEHFLALAARSGGVVKDSAQRHRMDAKLLNQVGDDFERAIWGEPARVADERVNAVTNNLVSATPADRPRFELAEPFHLRIMFGSADGIALPNQTVVGGKTKGHQPETVAVETQTKIVGVALTGVERTLDDSGRPVMETYSFVAKDVT